MKDAWARVCCLVASDVIAPLLPELAELLRRVALDEYLARRVQLAVKARAARGHA